MLASTPRAMPCSTGEKLAIARSTRGAGLAWGARAPIAFALGAAIIRRGSQADRQGDGTHAIHMGAFCAVGSVHPCARRMRSAADDESVHSAEGGGAREVLCRGHPPSEFRAGAGGARSALSRRESGKDA